MLKKKKYSRSKSSRVSYKKLIHGIARLIFFINSRMSIYGYVLVLIFLLGLFLRLLGANPGWPYTHPDEPTINTSTRLIALQGDFKPMGYWYGQLLPLIYAIGIDLFFIPSVFFAELIRHYLSGESDLIGFLNHFFYYHLFYNSKFSDPLRYFYSWPRYETAILSSFGAVAGYWVGKKLFNKKVGLITAFLIAVNYRHVLSSGFTLADAPSGVFALLSIYLSLRLLDNRSTRTYIFAGIGLALSFSVKYIIHVLPVFIICHAVPILESTKGNFFRKIKMLFLNRNVFLAFVFCIFLFLVINIYLIFDFKTAFDEYKYGLRRYGCNSKGISEYFSESTFIGITYLFYYALSPILAITTVIGFLYSLIRYRLKSLIIASFVFPFLYFYLISCANTPVRNYNAIIPALLIFPSIIIYDLSTLFKNKRLQLIILIALSFFVGFISLRDSYFSSFYFSKIRNGNALEDWVVMNIPDSSIIATSAVSLPSSKKFREYSIEPVGPSSFKSMEELRKMNLKWIAIGSLWVIRYNNELRLNSGVLRKYFFDQRIFWGLMDNSYMSLIVHELGDYRIKEFVKPFWYSLEPPIFVAKFPEFWQPREDKLIISYDFEKPSQGKIFQGVSFDRNYTSYNLQYLHGDGFDGMVGVKINTNNCPGGIMQTELFTKKFPINKDKWYTLEGKAKLMNSSSIEFPKDGFFRLDFYDQENKKLKTYVSGLADNNNSWETLIAAGFAPDKAISGKISFQLDFCFISRQYFLDDIKVFESDRISKTKTDAYPYYDVELSKNYIWTPDL